MKKDNIDKLFENLNSDFDVEQPNLGHDLRFLKKLELQNKNTQPLVENNSGWSVWKKAFAVAAVVVLVLTFALGTQQNNQSHDLASVSPEMAVTQDFFTNAIQVELKNINLERTPETSALIDKALIRLTSLEQAYDNLKLDLESSGQDQRVIYAMISNFQTRIDLLQNVLDNIKEVKQLNQSNNENSNTI
ncbi:MAG: hypothetical protein BM564_02475 [Bacteroidetes bacterium MedPE-SWsnd-G2]|nr:MAG: hypothetical protein BM564_02475 [Bacteroidetes bacterium MedPE-SWsnd-G2]